MKPGDLVKLVRRSGGGVLAPLVRWEDPWALESDRWADEFPIDHPAVFLRFDTLAASDPQAIVAHARRVAWILIEGRIGWIEASYLAPM